jgi:hypothetical protein
MLSLLIFLKNKHYFVICHEGSLEVSNLEDKGPERILLDQTLVVSSIVKVTQDAFSSLILEKISGWVGLSGYLVKLIEEGSEVGRVHEVNASAGAVHKGMVQDHFE